MTAPTFEMLRAVHMALRTGASYRKVLQATREWNRMTDAEKSRFAAHLDADGNPNPREGVGKWGGDQNLDGSIAGSQRAGNSGQGIGSRLVPA